MSIEGASFRFETAARQCAFVGTAGQAVPELGTADWLLLTRVELLSGGTRVFDFVTDASNYIGAYVSTTNIRMEWRMSGTFARCDVPIQRHSTCFYLAMWRDGSNLRAGLLDEGGVFDSASASLVAAHNLSTLRTSAVAYLGRTSGGTFSASHHGHLSMWSGVTGSDITALTSDQWAQVMQRPHALDEVISGATLALSYSRLADSSGTTLDYARRTAIPAGTRLVDTISGNYMTLAIGSPSGDNSCYAMPNYTQPARRTDLQEHQFVSPQIAEIQGQFYRAATHMSPSNVRCPLLYPLDSDWQNNAWPLEIIPRWRYADSSDAGTIKTQVGLSGITVPMDYHYCGAVSPGTGNQAIFIFALHSRTNADEPAEGDTLYDSFGVYRINLDTGVVTWEAIDLGGTAATNVFTYAAMYTPPGETYTLAFVRGLSEGNAKGYAVQIDHTSGASVKQLTEPGATVKGFYPREVLDLGGGCYGFTYLDRLPLGGPSGYRMLVWDSAGVITDSANWYETATGTSPTLPLDTDDATGLLHTINSGEATAARDSYIGQSIADGRGNTVLALVRYEDELDDGWPSTPNAVEIRRLRNFSSATHTFGSTDITDITSVITDLKSTEPFNIQPVIRWSDSENRGAYLTMALLDGAALVENTDYDQFTGEFGTQVIGWYGLPLANPGQWTEQPTNPLIDTDVAGGRCVRPMPGVGPNDDTRRRVRSETSIVLAASGAFSVAHSAVTGLDTAASTTLRRNKYGVGLGFGLGL